VDNLFTGEIAGFFALVKRIQIADYIVRNYSFFHQSNAGAVGCEHGDSANLAEEIIAGQIAVEADKSVEFLFSVVY
jgi:hypothetical protein